MASKGSGKQATRSAAKKKPSTASGSTRKPAAPRSKVSEQARRQQEIAGVVLIAIGILLGLYMFFSAAGALGKWLSEALFGLFGWIAYTIPVLFIGLGVLSLAGGVNDKLSGMSWFVVLAVLSLVTLVQSIASHEIEGVKYMEYINAAYQAGSGTPHRGAGFVGAALAYLLLKLGGTQLAYILTGTLVLICIIAITRFSLVKLFKKGGDALLEAIESSKEHRDDPDPEFPDDEGELTLFDNPSKQPMKTYTMESDEPKEKPRKGAKKAARAEVQKAEQPPVLDENDLLEIMPTEGELKTRTGKKVKIKNPEPVVSDIWEELEKKGRLPKSNVPVFSENTDADADDLAIVPLPEKKPKKKPAAAESAAVPAVPVVSLAANAPAAYEPPPFTLLTASTASYARSGENPSEKARILIDTLASFHIDAKVTDITVGPVLTRFEVQIAPGIRVSRITTLSDNIAMQLAAQHVRIEAPIPGKSAVGVEIPNKDIVTVVLRDIVESREFQTSASSVTMALGKSINGKVIVADLAKMPHMLIAGATGSGKSVCINDIIVSLTYKSSPADVRMVLIDPKMVELSIFGVLPHLLIPVVTDPKKAAGALRWAVNEMTQRYKKFADVNARDLTRYNDLQTLPENRLPKIVVIIDELADLMMVAPDEVEDSIIRIAQLGRAAGLHLIIATQRPDANVITGLIKANVPSRCAFAVSSGIDSRIILDCMGAEKLLGRGDMLFHPNGMSKPMRVQCAFISDEEVEHVVDYFKKRDAAPQFDQKLVDSMATADKSGPTGGAFGEGKQEDDLLGDAVRVVMENGQASISMLQRRLRVGYQRASRLIDMMEQEGFVSGFDGSRARKVLIKPAEFAERFGGEEPSEPPAPTVEDE